MLIDYLLQHCTSLMPFIRIQLVQAEIYFALEIPLQRPSLQLINPYDSNNRKMMKVFGSQDQIYMYQGYHHIGIIPNPSTPPADYPPQEDQETSPTG